VEEPTITKSKKGSAGPEFNKEHAHCFFSAWSGFFTVNLFLLTLQSTMTFTMMFEKNMQRKRPELWRNHNWLHHDNAPTPTPQKTIEFVTNNNMAILLDLPYLPDLAPCDFALFPKLKMKLKGRRFEKVSDIEKESQVVLNNIKENDFHGAF
jgi:hypothetical protein